MPTLDDFAARPQSKIGVGLHVEREVHASKADPPELGVVQKNKPSLQFTARNPLHRGRQGEGFAEGCNGSTRESSKLIHVVANGNSQSTSGTSSIKNVHLKKKKKKKIK